MKPDKKKLTVTDDEDFKAYESASLSLNAFDDLEDQEEDLQPDETLVKKRKKRGSGVRYANSPQASLHGLSPIIDKIIKQKIANVPDYVQNILAFLPHDTQTQLVAKYQPYSLEAPHRNYNKAYRAFFGDETDLTNVQEIVILRMITDLMEYTHSINENNAWVFQEQINAVAGLFYDIVHDKSPRASQFDRLDFFSIALSMSTTIFVKYLTATKLEKLPTQEDIAPQTIEAALQACRQIETLIKQGIFHRVALTQKRMLDSGMVAFRTDNRKATNSVRVQDAMMIMGDDISSLCKSLEQTLQRQSMQDFFLSNTTALLEKAITEQLRAKPPKKPRKAYTRRKPKE